MRGLHYQLPHAQGKLVRVIRGRIFDVAVDMRRRSPTFGSWTGVELSADNRRQLWIPEGFAHGFCVMGDEAAEIIYRCTDYYCPEAEHTLRWDDPSIHIDWPLTRPPQLSEKDRNGRLLADLPHFE